MKGGKEGAGGRVEGGETESLGSGGWRQEGGVDVGRRERKAVSLVCRGSGPVKGLRVQPRRGRGRGAF